jgi:hypothetical protein
VDETADQTQDDLGSQKAVPGPVFIEIKSVPLRSNARDLRLRDGDVIVAIDGEACHIDITEFEDLLLDARDDETSVLVTIGRDQMFFEIFMTEPLGVSLDYTDAQRAIDIAARLNNHSVGSKEQYHTYEALRDVHRHVTVYSTQYSGLATICPPIWLLQHRAVEPLAAVCGAYAAAAAVHWAAFVITVILIGAYFHKVQFRIIRNYNIFTDHFYWVVCASQSVADAQKICREIDPKCVFSFSHVGPPQDNEVEDKKAARRSARAKQKMA